jgi:hypothetical protein
MAVTSCRMTERALPFEMVEVRKETGGDDSQLSSGSTYEPHLVGCSTRTPVVLYQERF